MRVICVLLDRDLNYHRAHDDVDDDDDYDGGGGGDAKIAAA